MIKGNISSTFFGGSREHLATPETFAFLFFEQVNTMFRFAGQFFLVTFFGIGRNRFDVLLYRLSLQFSGWIFAFTHDLLKMWMWIVDLIELSWSKIMVWKMKEYTNDELPQRHEYGVGGFGGLRHIVVNYHKNGSVTRTVNNVDEQYATQKDFHNALEKMHQEYSNFLDRWNRPIS